MKIEIPDEVLDNVVKDYLKEAYNSIQESQDRIKSLPKPIPSYESENHKHNKRYLKGIKRTLSYYLDPSEYQNFFNEDISNGW